MEKLPKNKEIYPSGKVFYTFEHHNLEDLKVVIIGQDPFHTPGVATGLAFQSGKKGYLPPSLRNIIQEMEDDLGPHPEIAKALSAKDCSHIFNEELSKQGVLLLNTSLTVERGKPNSHSKIWEPITDMIIKEILEQKRNIVWILWGTHAVSKVRQYPDLIIKNNHFLIESSHPSPFSVDREIKGRAPKFKGSKPFSRTNQILKSLKKEEILWS